jgi:hypothetical protein
MNNIQQYYYDFCTCRGDARDYIGILRIIEKETLDNPYNQRGALLAKMVSDVGYAVRPSDQVLAKIIQDNIEVFATSYHLSLMEGTTGEQPNISWQDWHMSPEEIKNWRGQGINICERCYFDKERCVCRSPND